MEQFDLIDGLKLLDYWIRIGYSVPAPTHDFSSQLGFAGDFLSCAMV